jgi:hypothetical protein
VSSFLSCRILIHLNQSLGSKADVVFAVKQKMGFIHRRRPKVGYQKDKKLTHLELLEE